jgi:protein-disulfide isomerase
MKTNPTMIRRTAAAIVVLVLAWSLGQYIGSSREPADSGVGSDTFDVITADAAPHVDADALSHLDGVRQSGHVLGSPDAKVVMVEFEDLQCIACKQFDLSVSDRVASGLVADGVLRIERYPLTFIGPQSTQAAAWAYAAAEQDLMWQFTRVFFLNAGEENSGYANDEFLRLVAEATPGLDVQAAARAAKSADATQFLARAKSMASRYKVTGTPFVLLGPDVNHLQPIKLESSSDYSSIERGVTMVRQGHVLRQPSALNPNNCTVEQTTCGIK